MILRVVALVTCACLTCACGKDDAPKTREIHQRFDTRPPPNGAPAPVDSATARAPSGLTALFLDASAMRAANEEARAQMFPPTDPAAAAPPSAAAAPTATAAAPAVNPDDAILESARHSLGGCFSSLRAGPGAGPPTLDAKVQVTVIETGSVSRAEVLSSDVNDPAVIDCLRRNAGGLRFSDNDGGPLRTYTIDVLLVAH